MNNQKKSFDSFEIFLICISIFNIFVGLTSGVYLQNPSGLGSLIIGALGLGLVAFIQIDKRSTEILRSSRTGLKFNLCANRSEKSTDTLRFVGRWKDEPVHRPN